MSYFDAIELENLNQNPYCIHGPTILFENINQEKRFYSCSTIRNHKKCKFYQTYRQFKKTELRKWYQIYKKHNLNTKRLKRLRLKLKSQDMKKRIYCKTCDQFIFSKKQKSICNENKHGLMIGIKKTWLKEPSKHLLNALTDNEANAVSNTSLMI